MNNLPNGKLSLTTTVSIHLNIKVPLMGTTVHYPNENSIQKNTEIFLYNVPHSQDHLTNGFLGSMVKP